VFGRQSDRSLEAKLGGVGDEVVENLRELEGIAF
jgi:hypothetical protein